MARRRYCSLIYSNLTKEREIGTWKICGKHHPHHPFSGVVIYIYTYMYIYIYVYIHTTTQKDRKVIYHYISWNLFTFLSIWVGMKNKEI